MGLASILDYFGEQAALSGSQNYAKKMFGEGSKEDLLAQEDPRLFRQMLPSILEKQQQQEAIGSVFGRQQPPQGMPQITSGDLDPLAPIPQTLPNQSALGSLTQQEPQQDQSRIAMLQNYTKLPTALQSVVAKQLELTGNIAGKNEAIDKIAQGIADYRNAPLTGFALKSPMGMAVQERVLELNPEYDANVFKERAKTKADLSPGGNMGQKIGQAQTAINHLASYLEASEELGGANLGIASNPLNYLYNKWESQTPAYQRAARFQKMSADEVAKFVAGSSGGTQQDRLAQEELLSLTNSPEARKSAAQAAVATMFGKLEPIADQYNKSYGTNKTPADFLSEETKLSLAKLGMLPEGTEPPRSALAQILSPQARNPALYEEMKKRGLIK